MPTARKPKLSTVEHEVGDGVVHVVFVMTDGTRHQVYSVPSVPDGAYTPEGYFNECDAIGVARGAAEVARLAIQLAR